MKDKSLFLAYPPLVVDLDGTLIQTDLFSLSLRRYVGWKFWRLLGVLFFWLKGRAALKSFLAQRVPLRAWELPYNPSVIDLIRTEKAKGRIVALATGSDRRYAHQIADYLGFFDEVFGSHDTVNLIRFAKKDLLVRLWGEKGFDYLGNSQSDLPVWAAARYAYVVKPERGVLQKARALGNVLKIID